MTPTCRHCRRPLTDPRSRARGIGPECRAALIRRAREHGITPAIAALLVAYAEMKEQDAAVVAAEENGNSGGRKE